MSLPIAESLYAQILGRELLNHLKDEESNVLQRIKELDSKAVQILEEIRAILDDTPLTTRSALSALTGLSAYTTEMISAPCVTTEDKKPLRSQQERSGFLLIPH